MIEDDLHDDILDAHEEASAARHGFELRKIIDFGLSVQQFIDGDIGRQLEIDARTERVMLTEKYVLLDPSDPGDLLQMKVMRARIHVLNCWQEFLASYIQAGRTAQAEFLQLEEDG